MPKSECRVVFGALIVERFSGHSAYHNPLPEAAPNERSENDRFRNATIGMAAAAWATEPTGECGNGKARPNHGHPRALRASAAMLQLADIILSFRFLLDGTLGEVYNET